VKDRQIAKHFVKDNNISRQEKKGMQETLLRMEGFYSLCVIVYVFAFSDVWGTTVL